jgi:hypothetical protein
MLRSLAVLGSIMIAAPAGAASYYASLATPTAGRVIARDIVWACGAAGCQGATQESRPLVLCQSLAKQAGKVGSFIVDGRPFAAAELDKCNSLAKAPAAAMVATR